MAYRIEYSIGQYQIRVNIWFLIVFLLVQTLLNELGFWQLERAQQKHQRLAQMERGSETQLTDLTQLTQQQIEQFQSVELQLTLADQTILLLDNKIDHQRPGYHVLNIVQEKNSGKYLLVNRGWIFAGLDRNTYPEIEPPTANWKVNARIYPIIEESISTNSASIEEQGNFLRLPVLDQLVLAELEQRLRIKLEPYLLRVNQDSEAALLTNWVWTNMTPEKHLAYAFQWFALALAFLIISLIVSIRKR